MKYFIFIFIFILVSCSQGPVKPAHSPAIDSFYQSWQTDYAPENNQVFSEAYKDYLYSVEKILPSNKLESYLFSLKNYFQIMAHTEFSRPNRSESQKKKALVDMHWRLSKERREKLQKELEEPVFTKLLNNNRRQFHTFPL